MFVKHKHIGLTWEQVKKNQIKYGWNELQKRQRTPFLLKVFKKLLNPLILILLFSVVLSVLLGQKTDSFIIGIILFISLFLDAYQENQAENATEELRKKLIFQALVLRDGQEIKIPVREVTVGDIIIFSAGNIIPADARIIEADNLSLNEAEFTGEFFPKEKNKGEKVFMNSHVVSGFGKAVVLSIGDQTRIGKINELIDRQKPLTEFQKGLNKFSFFLLRATIILSLALFLGKVYLGHDLILSLMFVLALAIGFAPELLPMILTINLAKGAFRMAKGKVLVKFLPSIENLGSMDVLCADKTGTLTEGNIILESAINILGQEDKKVLEYAWLNSCFQSGYKNPLDEAILKKTGKCFLKSSYEKIDEIPYDFHRKKLSVILRKDGKNIMVTKGAIHLLLPLCKNEKDVQIDFKKINQEGFRILGVAIKEVEDKKNYGVEDEKDLLFVGILTFSDILKKNTDVVVKNLKKLGVDLKIITGDNELVTESLCKKLGMENPKIVVQEEIEKMSERKLSKIINEVTIFARVNPETKLRIINSLKDNGRVVGYLGDGINDAPALKNADVGISVENAFDVAKESADMVILKKDLKILQTGIQEGRRTFANIMKYILMGTSSTFGNMISLSLSSVILPFLPMLPVQVFLNDLLYDFSQILLVKDNVDAPLVKKPYRWDIKFIKKFMIIFGSTSSLFDILTFFILYETLKASSGMFQTGWFLESALSQMFIVFSIRTAVVPFYKSKTNHFFAFGILGIVCFVLFLPFSFLAPYFHLAKLPLVYFMILPIILFAYVVFTEILKYYFYHRLRKKLKPLNG